MVEDIVVKGVYVSIYKRERLSICNKPVTDNRASFFKFAKKKNGQFRIMFKYLKKIDR